MGASAATGGAADHGGAARAAVTADGSNGEAIMDVGEGGNGRHLDAARDDEGDADGEAGVEDEPTADELHEQWNKAKRLVAWLAGEGYQPEDPTRVDAERRAAAAEHAWRGTQPGVRVSRRLLGAEEALTRAKKAQAKQEQALDDLDNWYDAERSAQVEWLAELRGRTRAREDKLAEISRLAADEFGGGREEEGGPPLRDAVEAIESDLAPTMRELFAAAPENSELRAKLSGAMGAITAVYSIVTQEARGRWADQYDIARDDDGYDDGGQWQQYDTYANDQWSCGWYDRHRGGSWGQRWDWHADDDADGDADDGNQARMDLADVQVPPWMRQASDDADWGTRAWKRGRRLWEDAQGFQGRQIGGREHVADHENAAILQAAVHDAAAKASETPCPPTPPLVDQELEDRKQAVWDQAQTEDIAVSSEEIANVSREQLEAWAAANLVP